MFQHISKLFGLNQPDTDTEDTDDAGTGTGGAATGDDTGRKHGGRRKGRGGDGASGGSDLSAIINGQYSDADSVADILVTGLNDLRIPESSNWGPASWPAILVTSKRDDGGPVDWHHKPGSRFLTAATGNNASIVTYMDAKLVDSGRFVVLPTPSSLSKIVEMGGILKTALCYWAIISVSTGTGTDGDDLEAPTIITVTPTNKRFGGKDLDALMDAGKSTPVAKTVEDLRPADQGPDFSDVINGRAAEPDGGDDVPTYRPGPAPRTIDDAPRTEAMAPIAPAAPVTPAVQAPDDGGLREDLAAVADVPRKTVSDPVIPAAPEPVPIPVPEPQPAPEPAPAPEPDPEPEPQPAPIPAPAPEPEPAPAQDALPDPIPAGTPAAPEQTQDIPDDGSAARYDASVMDPAISQEAKRINEVVERTVAAGPDDVQLGWSTKDIDAIIGAVPTILIEPATVARGHTPIVSQQIAAMTAKANADYTSRLNSDLSKLRTYYGQLAETNLQKSIEAVAVDHPATIDGEVVNREIMDRYRQIEDTYQAELAGIDAEAERMASELRERYEQGRDNAGELGRARAEEDYERRNRPTLDDAEAGLRGRLENQALSHRDESRQRLLEQRQQMAERYNRLFDSRGLVQAGDLRRAQAKAEQEYAHQLTRELQQYIISQSPTEDVEQRMLENDARVRQVEERSAREIETLKEAHKKEVDGITHSIKLQRNTLRAETEKVREASEARLKALQDTLDARDKDITDARRQVEEAHAETAKAKQAAEHADQKASADYEKRRERLDEERSNLHATSRRAAAIAASVALLLGVGISGPVAYLAGRGNADDGQQTHIVLDSGKD